MGVKFYMDVHVPGPLTSQLRRRGVDVLTAQEDGHDEAPDDALLERALILDRLLFTQDVLFRVMATNWQKEGREFRGLLFGAQRAATLGQYVEEIELIAKVSVPRNASS